MKIENINFEQKLRQKWALAPAWADVVLGILIFSVIEIGHVCRSMPNWYRPRVSLVPFFNHRVMIPGATYRRELNSGVRYGSIVDSYAAMGFSTDRLFIYNWNVWSVLFETHACIKGRFFESWSVSLDTHDCLKRRCTESLKPSRVWLDS